MEKRHIHRGIGAAVLLASLVAGAGSLVFSSGDVAVGVIETLPDAAHRVRQALFLYSSLCAILYGLDAWPKLD